MHALNLTNNVWQGVKRMIDIHSHILPGIDDGAKSEEDSLQMAKQAVEQGIHTMIATPHHKTTSFNNPRESIIMHTNILNKLLQSHDIPLTLLPGQETRINGDFLTDLQKGDILGLNETDYLFVELPFDHVPLYTESMLYDLQMSGYKPIIVHPERNRELLDQPDKLYDLVRKGALTQVTAGSLLGNFGKDVTRFTREIIEHHLTHFIATDAHNVTSRPNNLAEAYDFIQDEIGTDVYYTFLENAEYVIKNEVVHRAEPERVRRRKFFGLF